MYAHIGLQNKFYLL